MKYTILVCLFVFFQKKTVTSRLEQGGLLVVVLFLPVFRESLLSLFNFQHSVHSPQYSHPILGQMPHWH